MIDLHSHIIFDIDDGAETLEVSCEMLKKAKSIGIEKIIATPHFTIGENVDTFLKRRDKRLEKLKEACAVIGLNIALKAGAEVYITDEIFNEENLKSLTLGDSNVLLCEFKYHGVNPGKFLEYIDYIQNEGIKPLIAHVERYSFIRNNPMLLESLISRDVIFQVNAISLFEDSEEGDFARMLVDEKLVTTLGSDIHHVPSRRYKAMEKLGKFEDDYIQDLLNKNPEKIFDSF